MSVLLKLVSLGSAESVAKDYKYICRLDRLARERSQPCKSQARLFD